MCCFVQLRPPTPPLFPYTTLFRSAGANPSITLPLGTAPGQNPLEAEIMGQSNANADSADPTVGSTRNAVLTISTYTVNMDIDRLYAQPMSGAPAAFGGSAQQAGVQISHRIDG